MAKLSSGKLTALGSKTDIISADQGYHRRDHSTPNIHHKKFDSHLPSWTTIQNPLTKSMERTGYPGPLLSKLNDIVNSQS
jgi:hypothetical protein